jgi:hypothetical protein
MPTWAKIVLRSVGIVNSAVLLLGLSFMTESIYWVLTGRVKAHSDTPYFHVAFTIMAIVELVFISIFLSASIRFVRGNLSAANRYSFAVLSFVAYFVATGLMWRLGNGIGTSIGAATGLTGEGTAFFAFLLWLLHPMPFPLYPVVTAVLVQVIKWRYATLRSPRQGIA